MTALRNVLGNLKLLEENFILSESSSDQTGNYLKDIDGNRLIEFYDSGTLYVPNIKAEMNDKVFVNVVPRPVPLAIISTKGRFLNLSISQMKMINKFGGAKIVDGNTIIVGVGNKVDIDFINKFNSINNPKSVNKGFRVLELSISGLKIMATMSDSFYKAVNEIIGPGSSDLEILRSLIIDENLVKISKLTNSIYVKKVNTSTEHSTYSSYGHLYRSKGIVVKTGVFKDKDEKVLDMYIDEVNKDYDVMVEITEEV